MRRVSRQINRSLFTSIVLKFYICCVTFVLSNTMAFICSRGSRSMVNNVASNSGSSRVRVPFRSRTANDVHQLKKHHGGMASHRHHFVWFDNKLTRVIASSILAISVARPASAVISIPNAAAGASTTSYHLSRILFLRLLAVVYLSAFSVARFQNKGLIGGASCVFALANAFAILHLYSHFTCVVQIRASLQLEKYLTMQKKEEHWSLNNAKIGFSNVIDTQHLNLPIIYYPVFSIYAEQNFLTSIS